MVILYGLLLQNMFKIKIRLVKDIIVMRLKRAIFITKGIHILLLW